MHDDIIDRIYEAAFAPDQWPGVLEEISSRAGSASGAVLSMSGTAPPVWRATNLVCDTLHQFVATGQWKDCERPMRLLAMDYPGFVSDEDYLTPAADRT